MKAFGQTAIGRNLHYYIFIVFICVYLVKLNDVCTKYNRYEKVLNEDAFGYYVILPAFLKYEDPEFRFLEKDHSLRFLPQYRYYVPPVVNEAPNGKKVCKYYAGVALLQLPFYLAADTIAEKVGDATGFESTYQMAILFSVVFYLILGFLQTLKIMVRLGLKPLFAVLMLPLILFGTNLYAYTTFDMAYSHVYSYFALVFFIHFLLRLREKFNVNNAFLCGVFYGLILLIRPLNGISILFAPVIFNFSELRMFFSRRNLVKTGVLCLGAAMVLSIQSLLWYWQTELFYVYPYGDEKLDLANPRMMELIFGFDSGWAVYTPLPFLMLVFALCILLRNRQYAKFLWAGFCSFSILYLLSCWGNLHYGCTVGCRPITEFYGPIAILCACASVPLFKKKSFRWVFFSLSYLLVYYNQVIHYQFYENIINWCDMDKARFKMVFMKTEQAYRYSTSKFWDFERYGKSRDTLWIPLNRTLHIDKEKENDTFSLHPPYIELRDSFLLMNIRLKCRMQDKINESFLRILVTNNGDYIDLHNFLLKRKVNVFNEGQELNYEFHMEKPLPSGKMHFSLESVDGKGITTLEVVGIQVNRIKL